MDCPWCGFEVSKEDKTCPDCGLGLLEGEREDEPEIGKETSTVGVPSVKKVEGKLTSIGKYKIVKLLAQGAMAKVFLAKDMVLEREVAIKTMIAGDDASEEAIARFMSEAKSAGRLKHPSIISVYEVGQSRSLYYMVMDYIKGKTLKELILLGGESDKRIAEIMRDTAQALHYAHERGIIHRDIKPANIMLDEEGVIHLMDFGLARDLETDYSITQSGEIIGTPAYLNPEQAGGHSKEVDARSDIYSLGAVMYEFLTGRTPVDGTTVMEFIQNVLEKDPAQPSQLTPHVNKELETICLKAMFKEPGRRYQTAEEMADDLQRFIDDEPIAARPASIIYRTTKFVKKNTIAVLVVSIIVLTASGIGGYFYKEHVETVRAKTAAEEIKREEERKRRLEERKRHQAEQEAEEKKAQMEKVLAEKEDGEKRSWIPIYEENFDKITRLPPHKWDVTKAGSVKDKALYINGKEGGTVIWLKVAILGEDWRFEYDGWPDEKAEMLNDIGLFVKADKEGELWQNGFEIQFGGNNNLTSRIIHEGRDIYRLDMENTIKKGHKYHFSITYLNGVLEYIAVDTTTNETIIDVMREVPDINIVKENQRQGFWTWGSRIYIDNIKISKLGVPKKRTYRDVAQDFLEVVGRRNAVKYLVIQLHKLPTTGEKVECFNVIVKYTLNASIRDKKRLTADAIKEYMKVFSGYPPSEVVQEELEYGFYDMCLDMRDPKGRMDPKLKKILDSDPAFLEHVKIRRIEWKVDKPKEKKDAKKK
jgi:serine/threonine protein kinase